MLYIRMFVIMAISLFSFRVLLQELGETGYGTYNVVGGIVVLFSFLSNAMTVSTQRYLAYWIGKEDNESLSKYFSMSINVQLFITLSIIILAETIGVWFLNSHMDFDGENMSVVNIVFQCSIATFSIQIMTVPLQATIIAHEKMSFYAYFSIAEALLRLGSVLILFFFNSNKLIIYSLAMVAVPSIVWFIYYVYSRSNFPACRYRYNPDKACFKEMVSFSLWNMLGGAGNVCASQGVNIIFNIFYGVAVNAAMGVTNQVSAAVSSFVHNLQTAFNPQIIKSYAKEDSEYFNSLIFRSSRFSFFLIFIIGFPIIICCRDIFEIWLTEIPEYSVQFTQLIIMFCMIDALSGSLWTAAQATGRIKKYMIVISLLIFSNLPAAYIILSLGLSPVWVIIYKVIMNLTIHFTRIAFLKHLTDFPGWLYIKKVMMPALFLVALSAPAPIIIYNYISGIIPLLSLIIFTIIESSFLGFYILLTSNERTKIKELLAQKLKLRSPWKK